MAHPLSLYVLADGRTLVSIMQQQTDWAMQNMKFIIKRRNEYDELQRSKFHEKISVCRKVLVTSQTKNVRM